MRVWELAANAIVAGNALNTGRADRLTCSRRMNEVFDDLRAAWARAHEHDIANAARLNAARRGNFLTGVGHIELVSSSKATVYSRVVPRSLTHEPLRHLDVDEPSCDTVVRMIDVLDPTDARFYSEEAHLVSWEAKSTAQFLELQEHYGFVGGSYGEYKSYFLRSDLPKGMWFSTAPPTSVQSQVF